MIRSAIARSSGAQVEPAQLVVQIVLQRLRPGDHVGHRVELALAVLLDLAARRLGALLEVVGPLLVHLHQPLEVVLVRVRSRRSPTRVLPRLGASGACGPRLALRPASSGSSSCSSSTGFSSISCSIRSSSARIGNCRISIDWIIRGASTCFCTSRRSWPRDSRMVVVSG